MKKHQGHPTTAPGKPLPPGAAPSAWHNPMQGAAAGKGHPVKKTAHHHPVKKKGAPGPAGALGKGQSSAAAKGHHHKVKHIKRHSKVAKWSPGLDVACCAAEALAASARLAGHQVTDGDVLALYWRTAAHEDQGATLWETIEAAGAYGIGAAQLTGARPATLLGTGVVLGVDLQERHALTLDGHGVWTWGEWRPAPCTLLAAADEAWDLTWAAVA